MPNNPQSPLQNENDTATAIMVGAFITFGAPSILFYWYYEPIIKWYFPKLEWMLTVTAIIFGIVYAFGFVNSLKYFRVLLKGVITPKAALKFWGVGVYIAMLPHSFVITYTWYQTGTPQSYYSGGEFWIPIAVLGLIGPFVVVNKFIVRIWWIGEDEAIRRINAYHEAQETKAPTAEMSFAEEGINIDSSRFENPHTKNSDPEPKGAEEAPPIQSEVAEEMARRARQAMNDPNLPMGKRAEAEALFETLKRGSGNPNIGSLQKLSDQRKGRKNK